MSHTLPTSFTTTAASAYFPMQFVEVLHQSQREGRPSLDRRTNEAVSTRQRAGGQGAGGIYLYYYPGKKFFPSFPPLARGSFRETFTSICLCYHS